MCLALSDISPYETLKFCRLCVIERQQLASVFVVLTVITYHK
jgi:hypothetical protein